MPSYECLLELCRRRRGLYILGAGASIGAAPFGKKFWTAAPIDYLRNTGSFPVVPPTQSELTQKMIANSRGLSVSEIFPSREIRPGSDEFPLSEFVQRMPNLFARSYLKNQLSEFRFLSRQCDSYRIFQSFHPSLISNYNHDGLATYFASQNHRVIDMHGTIEPGYGSAGALEFIEAVREYDLPEVADGILMGLPELHSDLMLERRLMEVGRFSPEFIAIIGYSFAQTGAGYDDWVSLESFLRTRRNFPGSIYVIGPQPETLRDVLADGTKSNKVFGVRTYWNVLAHAFLRTLTNQNAGKSLNYLSEETLDLFGSDVAFPLIEDRHDWRAE